MFNIVVNKEKNNINKDYNRTKIKINKHVNFYKNTINKILYSIRLETINLTFNYKEFYRYSV